jgi:hypothetical protein
MTALPIDRWKKWEAASNVKEILTERGIEPNPNYVETIYPHQRQKQRQEFKRKNEKLVPFDQLDFPSQCMSVFLIFGNILWAIITGVALVLSVVVLLFMGGGGGGRHE